MTTADGGREISSSAIHLCGGNGFRWEAAVHWLLKRAQLDSAFLSGATSSGSGAVRRRARLGHVAA